MRWQVLWQPLVQNILHLDHSCIFNCVVTLSLGVCFLGALVNRCCASIGSQDRFEDSVMGAIYGRFLLLHARFPSHSPASSWHSGASGASGAGFPRTNKDAARSEIKRFEIEISLSSLSCVSCCQHLSCFFSTSHAALEDPPCCKLPNPKSSALCAQDAFPWQRLT